MRGKLTDTTFADTARRLSNDGVTGALEVTGPPGVARVFFRTGGVYWAMSPAPRARLGDRLVNAGFITQDQLDDTLEAQQQADERVKLGALLVDRGLVGRDVIRVFVQEQILDALFDLVQWQEGDWVFHSGDAVEDKLPIDVPVAQLLVEVSRRQHEWDQIERVMPTLDAIPDHVVGGNATTAALEQDEFTMLASIDGSRSVRELASDLGYSEFEAGRIVYGLTLLGIVEITAADAPAEEAGPEETGPPEETSAPEATTATVSAPPDTGATADAAAASDQDEHLDVGEALEHALFGEASPEEDEGLQVTVHFALEDDEPEVHTPTTEPATDDEPEVHTPTTEPAAATDEPDVQRFAIGDDEPEVHTPTTEATAATDEPDVQRFAIGDDEPEVHTPGVAEPAPTEASAPSEPVESPATEPTASFGASSAPPWDADEEELDDEPEPWVFTAEDFDAELGPSGTDEAAPADEGGEPAAAQAATADHGFDDVFDTGSPEDADDEADVLSEDLEELVADITGLDEDQPAAERTEQPAATDEPEPAATTASPPPPPGSSAPGAPPAGAAPVDATSDQPAPARERGDVSAFLRELTQLSADDEDQDEDEASDDAPSRPSRSSSGGDDEKDDKKKKGGLFGWGR